MKTENDFMAMILSHFGGTAAAVQPEGLKRIACLMAAHGQASPDGKQVAVPSRAPRTGEGGKVAVIRVAGVMIQRSSVLDGSEFLTSTSRIRHWIADAVSDKAVSAIVLDINSPGGEVMGTPELASDVKAAAGIKPVYAQISGMGASAAYWVASQAARIVIQPSGEAGSIGVYSMHVDESGWLEQAGIKVTEITAGDFKAEFSPWKPLTEEAKAEAQKQVDIIYRDFVSAVASGRRRSVSDVESSFGKGRTFLAREALSAGMVDAIGTLGETIRMAETAQVPAGFSGARSQRERAIALASIE